MLLSLFLIAPNLTILFDMLTTIYSYKHFRQVEGHL